MGLKFKISWSRDPKSGNRVKVLRSESYNYQFDYENGTFYRWGKTFEDDPRRSPFGPEILDCEITTGCKGIGEIGGNRKLCQYCYKSNTPQGENMSLTTFQEVFKKIDINHTITQVALGLDSTCEMNQDLWKICDWLRERRVVPNGTVADLSPEIASKIAASWGACAVSYHDNWSVFNQTVYNLVEAKKQPGSTLKQVNCHYMICEETYDDCIELFHHVKTDPMLAGLNAIVLLSLKKCGRAKSGPFTQLSEDKFKKLVDLALDYNIQIGFDSCSEPKFLRAIKGRPNYDEMEMLAEPCESFAAFSSYVNVRGEYYPCSFCEDLMNGVDILRTESFIDNIWNGDTMMALNYESEMKGRECLFYKI
jgi:uncharacterized protein YukE